jgi:hypothetical protein
MILLNISIGINILHHLGLKVENRFLNLFVLIIQYTINNNTRKKKRKNDNKISILKQNLMKSKNK